MAGLDFGWTFCRSVIRAHGTYIQFNGFGLEHPARVLSLFPLLTSRHCPRGFFIAHSLLGVWHEVF
jgi:hypothetical protein